LNDAFIALHGDLGTGKTTFVRHLMQALGVTGRIKSPTYAIVESYSLERLNVWHFDFYRFSDPREWEEAGFRDLFASIGLKLVEWPEKAAAMLPTPDLELHIRASGETTRDVALTARTATGVTLLRAVQIVGAGV
jgi:tRNA threonylcarbamoyladenosine biosynthesis protein TsaE